MRLYGIQEADLIAVLDSPDSLSIEEDRRIAAKSIPRRFLRVSPESVYTVKGDEVIIITAYPLTRGSRR